MERFLTELILSLMVFVTVLVGIFAYQRILYRMLRSSAGGEPGNDVPADSRSPGIRIGKRKGDSNESQTDPI